MFIMCATSNSLAVLCLGYGLEITCRNKERSLKSMHHLLHVKVESCNSDDQENAAEGNKAGGYFQSVTGKEKAKLKGMYSIVPFI